MTTTYCTVANLGYWCSLNAKIETAEPDEYGIIDHKVTFVLINKFGDTMDMGVSVIGEVPSESRFMDEHLNFPTLDAAIRHSADALLTVSPMPGQRVNHAARYELWQGGVQAAF